MKKERMGDKDIEVEGEKGGEGDKGKWEKKE